VALADLAVAVAVEVWALAAKVVLVVLVAFFYGIKI
jgi:hypothetical protein